MGHRVKMDPQACQESPALMDRRVKQGQRAREDLQENVDVPACLEEALEQAKDKMESSVQSDPVARGEAQVHLDMLVLLDHQESQEMMV